MEFINESDFNDINLFINTKEDTIDITLNDISDAVDNDKRINDVFIDTKNKYTRKSSNNHLDDVIEQAVVDFKNTKCDKYFNIIYNKYSNIIKKWSVRSAYSNNDVAEDLYSDIMGVVLLNAINTWEPNGTAKFNTYLWTCIKFHMCTRKNKMNAFKRTADNTSVSINDTNSYNKDGDKMTLEGILVGQDDIVDSNIEIINVIDNLRTISDRNKKILKMIVHGYRYEDISKEVGITGAAAKLFLKRFGKTAEGVLFYKVLKN